MHFHYAFLFIFSLFLVEPSCFNVVEVVMNELCKKIMMVVLLASCVGTNVRAMEAKEAEGSAPEAVRASIVEEGLDLLLDVAAYMREKKDFDVIGIVKKYYRRPRILKFKLKEWLKSFRDVFYLRYGGEASVARLRASLPSLINTVIEKAQCGGVTRFQKRIKRVFVEASNEIFREQESLTTDAPASIEERASVGGRRKHRRKRRRR